MKITLNIHLDELLKQDVQQIIIQLYILFYSK
jgi:hypothetical protein